MTYPFKTKALRVEQPLGTYYVAVIPARILLDVAFSDRMRASLDEQVGYSVDGTQRGKNANRPTQIADYIDRGDSAFPNSIILAANYEKETGHIRTEESDDDDEAQSVWSVEELADGCFELTIPSAEPLAGIIDGQHRLDGFRNVDNPDRRNMELICSIFMGLPKPFQAQLFATINSTQKQVNKSLTYELFGYNIADEPAERWTPDKLAVFLTRRLNTLEESPLRGRIAVAPLRDRGLEALNDAKDWHVSTATIVEGILRLISSNPKRDTNAMLSPPVKSRSALLAGPKDRTPLREVYIKGQDALLYGLVLNFLKVCDETFWQRAKPNSFIIKTVGIQALFDVLRRLAPEAISTSDATTGFFQKKFAPAADIDFSTDRFQNASGSGRSTIRKALLAAMGIE
jgi:DNA phosphorothioation-associated DGQHR protein 1